MKKISTRRDFIGAAALAGAGLGLAAKSARAAAGKNAANGRAPARKDALVEADRLIAAQIASGEVAAAALLVRQGDAAFARAYGKAEIQTPFLIASPTKPMTASAVMLLRDRKQLQLSDPVQKYVPQFKGGDRGLVTLKHLLTHTSGLPDMLPENVELRKRHAPLADFVAGTCKTALLFKPGAKVSYQSMGTLLAATVVEKISGQPMPVFLAENIFKPLRMTRTSLGLGGRKISAMAQCQVPEPSDWDWNSEYWRNLAAPWGGAHSTVQDLATFIENFSKPGPSLWLPETRAEMLAIQTTGLGGEWGLGWLRQARAFAKTCSAATYGHFGSTGTVVWRDPEADLTFVLLTTKPAERSSTRLIGPVSDLIARAYCG